ncbi:MAG TPA: VWA domain-containing protein [Aestuariivirgaceae bacterium]|jgi:hypothetical protein
MPTSRKPNSTAPVPVAEQGTAVSRQEEIESFLADVRSRAVTQTGGARGRLLFAMDATMSRQPTWDRALQLQSEMFRETARIGGLDVQLVYFRGFGECRSSKWVSDPTALAELMTKVSCRGGYTQVRKVLAHIRQEATKAKVNAVVYVGDAFEENIDQICQAAGEVGLVGVPLFMFLEGRDAIAERAFQEIARLTRGAFCRFDEGSAHQLRDLLSAVAVYAAGGRKALQDFAKDKGGNATLLLQQLK